MKPFDLQAAFAGAKVVTRDGREATQLTHFQNLCEDEDSVFAVIDGKVYSFLENGRYYSSEDNALDLFMATITRKLWINIYLDRDHYTAGYLYDTEDAAKSKIYSKCVATVPIEFEV